MAIGKEFLTGVAQGIQLKGEGSGVAKGLAAAVIGGTSISSEYPLVVVTSSLVAIALAGMYGKFLETKINRPQQSLVR